MTHKEIFGDFNYPQEEVQMRIYKRAEVSDSSVALDCSLMLYSKSLKTAHKMVDRMSDALKEA